MNITKKNLTTGEINAIVNDMLKQKTYLQAIVSRDMLLLYFCTDLKVLDDNGVVDASFDVYDKYKEDGTINKVLSEINDDDLLLIEECYQNEKSMNTVFGQFLDDLSKKIDKYSKGINLQKIMNNLKEMSKVDKK